MRTLNQYPFLLFFLIIGNTIVSCDDTVEPFSGDIIDMYSVFGYIDTEADTQWVRVTPIRESIVEWVDTIEARVTLTEIGGVSAELVPKAYYFRSSSLDTLKYWNYWTTMNVLPNRQYEVSVENPDGSRTFVELDTPPGFEQPLVDGNYITFPILDTLADVRMNWWVYDHSKERNWEFSFSHLWRVNIDRETGWYVTFIDPDADFLKFATIMGYPDLAEARAAADNGTIEVLRTQAIVVEAGNDWIDFFELDEDEIAIQSTQANIVNGVGYMVGAVVKEVPFEVCPGDVGDFIACNPSSSD